ncbi:hypothetical protein KHP62_21760, partial [Rhodobacteraceae bacterium NNCM2]|nr:hypothetical protein [Coraliihabitans acroporae]
PKTDREDICPHKKQTIHNALKRKPQGPRTTTAIIYEMTPELKHIRYSPLNPKEKTTYFVDEEYLVTALVPSETACLASSPGRMRRTEVWISLDEMVLFLL